jgi:hypothetical protein
MATNELHEKLNRRRSMNGEGAPSPREPAAAAFEPAGDHAGSPSLLGVNIKDLVVGPIKHITHTTTRLTDARPSMTYDSWCVLAWTPSSLRPNRTILISLCGDSHVLHSQVCLNFPYKRVKRRGCPSEGNYMTTCSISSSTCKK